MAANQLTEIIANSTPEEAEPKLRALKASERARVERIIEEARRRS